MTDPHRNYQAGEPDPVDVDPDEGIDDREARPAHRPTPAADWPPEALDRLADDLFPDGYRPAREGRAAVATPADPDSGPALVTRSGTLVPLRPDGIDAATLAAARRHPVASGDERAQARAEGLRRSRTARHWIGLSPRGYRVTAVITTDQWGPADRVPMPITDLTAVFWHGDPNANPLDDLLIVSRTIDGDAGPNMMMWPVSPEIAHAWNGDDDGVTLAPDEASWLLVLLDHATTAEGYRGGPMDWANGPTPRRVAESYLGGRGRCICDSPREDLEPAEGCPVHDPRCRVCGCGDASPCVDDTTCCSWARPDLCTRCQALDVDPDAAEHAGEASR